MKTNSRRRVLISSVAMLLVALVALSTATFAWFTSSTTATAQGMNVKTAQASKLQISDYTKAWGTTVNYNVSEKLLLPSSTADGSTWWKGNAAANDNYAVNSEGFSTATSPVFDKVTSSDFAYADQLNVQNAGDADVENVTITWSIPKFEGSNYLRVALVPADKDGNMVEGAFISNIYDADGVAYKAVEEVNKLADVTPKTTCSIKVGGDGILSKDEVYYYNLFVWFEGQDEQCIDKNAGQVIADIQFTVTGNTVDQTA